MSIFYKVLENSKANKELIGLWKYNDDDGFWCGYVINFNENFIKIQHYTKFGKKDGIIIAQVSDIESVDFQDDYAQAMQHVIDNANKLENEVTIPIDLAQSEDWQLEYLKQLEGNSNIIVSIEINSNYFSGFIQEVSEGDFIIHCVGKLGEDEGNVIYKLEDITGLKINDLENRKRKLLYDWRKSILK